MVPGALALVSLLAVIHAGRPLVLPALGASTAEPTGPVAIEALAPGGRYASLGEAVTRARYRVEPLARQPGTYTAANPAHRLDVQFKPRGVKVTPRTGAKPAALNAVFRTLAIGRGVDLQPITPGPATVREGRVEFAHRTASGTLLLEWWENEPDGLEQGWTFFARDEGGRSNGERVPASAKSDSSHPSSHTPQPLTVRVAVEGGLTPVVAADGQSVDLRCGAASASVLHGAGLKAWDAAGRDLPIRMRCSQDHRSEGTPAISLEVDDTNAVYPVSIDPTWTQQPRLTADDASAGDGFGTSIAMDGTTVIVGAAGDESSTGAAYVFVRSGNVWTQQQKLTASDGVPGARFGIAVALAGNRLVIGADGPAGRAYVFERSAGNRTQQAILTPNSPSSNTFGGSVALDGNRVVVGAFSLRAAFVYEFSGGTWTELSQLPSPLDGTTPPTTGNYADSVAIRGVRAYVGAWTENSMGVGSGVVHVYEIGSPFWTYVDKLVPFDPAGGQRFGYSLAYKGSTLLVGAPGDQDARGSAYAFTAGSPTRKLTAAESAPADQFGSAVAIDGTTAVVGAFGADHAIFNAGAAYVFRRQGTTWNKERQLLATDAGFSDQFGISVAVAGDTVAVGANNVNHVGSGSGAAYTFDATNEPPVTQADRTLTVLEDTITGLGITAPTDADGDALTITVNTVPNAAKGLVRKAGAGAVLAVNSTLTPAELAGLEFHPVLNQLGPAGTFVYTVNDGLATDFQTLTLEITPVNDAPVAQNDAYSLTEDTTLAPAAPGVLANDSDVDHSLANLTAVLVSGPGHGALTLFGDGSFLYQPEVDYFGPDSYTYLTRDAGGAESQPATVSLTVTPFLNAPTGLIALQAGPTDVRLTWTDGSSDETGFEIRCKPGNAAAPGTYQLIATVAANRTTFTDYGLVPGASYTYLVTAINASGSSAPAGPATATLTVDTTKPTATLVATRPGPPVQIEIAVRDTGSGLASIEVLIADNCSVSLAPFTPGTTAPVAVTATKTDSSRTARVVLRIRDLAGNSLDGDPIVTELVIPAKKTRVVQTFTGLPQAESWLSVQNGTPGVKKLTVKVNRSKRLALALRSGQTREADMASRLTAGDTNTIQLTATGKPGSRALVTIAEPPSGKGASALRVQWQLAAISPRVNLDWHR